MNSIRTLMLEKTKSVNFSNLKMFIIPFKGMISL